MLLPLTVPSETVPSETVPSASWSLVVPSTVPSASRNLPVPSTVPSASCSLSVPSVPGETVPCASCSLPVPSETFHFPFSPEVRSFPCSPEVPSFPCSHLQVDVEKIAVQYSLPTSLLPSADPTWKFRVSLAAIFRLMWRKLPYSLPTFVPTCSPS